MNGLRYIRTRCNLSISELADALDVTRQYISAWENGRKPIPKNRLKQLSEYFGISAHYFGEITMAQQNEINKMPLSRTDIENKTTFSFKVDLSNERGTLYLPESEVSFDQMMSAANRRKRDVLDTIKEQIEAAEGEKLIEKKIPAMYRSCHMYEYATKIQRYIASREPAYRTAARFEMYNIMNAVSHALGLKDDATIYDLKAGLSPGISHTDPAFVKKLTEEITEHIEDAYYEAGKAWKQQSGESLTLSKETRRLPMTTTKKENQTTRKKKFHINDADRLLSNKCKAGIKKKYPDGVPKKMLLRLEKELDLMKSHDHSSMYLLAILLAEESNRMQAPFMFRGTITSSLVMFVCGTTEINPMEEADGGAGLPFAITGDEFDQREPYIEMLCTPHFLIHSTNYLRSILAEYYPAPFPGLDEHAVGQMKTFLIPEGVDEKKYFPAAQKTIQLPYPYPLMDELYSVTFSTSEAMEQIDYEMSEGKDLTAADDYSGDNVAKVLDHIIQSEPSDKTFRQIEVRTYKHLLNAVCILHSTNLWRGQAKRMVLSGELPFEKMICSRDDLYIYLLKIGFPELDAYRLAENVRKGKGLTEEQEKNMQENGAEEHVIDMCKNVHYLFPKSYAAQIIRMHAMMM